MGSGFNSNTYIALRTIKYRDVFKRITCTLAAGDELGSAIANSIIVDAADREDAYGLEGQPYIDLMVTKKYIKIKA